MAAFGRIEPFDNRSYRKVYCAEDSGTTLVGGPVGPGMSPRNLMGSTLGDELRLATGFQSKVVAISLKDRASIMPGGHTANAAYWYDVANGHFVTSTYYMQTLPSWVAAFDQALPAKAYCGKAWQALPETPGGGRPGPEAVHPWLISATVPRQSIPRLAQRHSIHDRDRIKLRS